MKTYLIEGFMPQGSLLRFVSNECEGEENTKAGYKEFKEAGAQRVKVYEKKNVTEDFK